ncbi:MAG: choice-of-anchor D domain-containing protein [Bacteroidales bacterium]|nr:choice-of-anchor D domain-containing protein [Bacteroidales bacterium]
MLDEQSQGVAAFELLPSEYDFGEINTGEASNPVTFTLTNNGTAAGIVNSINITGADAANFSIINMPVLPLTVNASEGLNLNLIFSPDQASENTAQLNISTADGEFLATITGTGISQTVYSLPFIENWSEGSFDHQDWTFDNYLANWRVSGSGTNAPFAQFMYQPRNYNYNSSLISPMINIEGVDNLELSVDFYFSGYMYTGTEHLTIFILDNDTWIELDSYSNTADIEWITLTYDLGTLQGTHTQIKFEASGEDTDRYNNWNIDNIVLDEQSQGVAAFELLPSEYDFGEINTGESSNPVTFTLTNNGTTAGTVNSINITGADAANFSIINIPVLPLTVNANESINLNVVFSPDQAGENTAQLNISTANGEFMATITGTGISQTVYSLPFIENWGEGNFDHQDWTFDNYLGNWRVSGYGTNAPYAQFTYQPRNFNYNSSLISPLITIEDVSNLNLSVDFELSAYMTNGTETFKIFILNNDDWIELESISNTGNIEWTTLSYDLNFLQGSTTQIRFEISGEDTDRVNDWNIDNIVLDEQSQGVAAFELLPTEYDFGEINTGEASNPVTFTLTNNGTAAGTVNAINITGADAANFSIINMPVLPLTVNANESINLNIVFSPDQAGENTAQLNISTANGEFMATINGTGISQTVYSLPFIETWGEGNFDHQDWTFDNYLANWRISGSGANAPYAQFMYQPRNYNYNSSLISPMINIEGVENLELSFDFYFSGYMYTGTEHFKIFILDNDTWIELDSYSNTVDIEWMTLTYDLSTIQGTHTQIKFEASGEDTDRYNNWNIDNIMLDEQSQGVASFELLPTEYDFGEINTGEASNPATFTLTNNGTAAGTVNAINIIGANAANFSIVNMPVLPLTVNANESINLNVVFSPDQAGENTAQLNLNTSNGNFMATITGIGISQTVYSLPFIETWDEGTFEYQEWTFDNYLANWRIYGSQANEYRAQFMYQPKNLNYTSALLSPLIDIEGVDNLHLSVDFMLSSYMNSGTETFKILILNDDNWIELESISNTGNIEWTTLSYDINILQGSTTQIRFEISGEDTDRVNDWNIDNIKLEGGGQGVASFELVPGDYDFGEINTGETSNPATFTLTNNGTAAGTVNTINISGTNAASFSIVNMPALPLTVNANESINLNVVFSPDQAGENTAQLNINTTNGNFMSAITGIGISQTVYNLPFIETWDEGTFDHQDWTFDNFLYNWRISGSGANAPYAQFMYQPRSYDYSSSLISPMININGFSNLVLSVDFYFSGYMFTGTEHFKIFISDNDNWIELDSFSSTEDIEWETLTYDISSLQGTHTQIRFEAFGEDSDRINNWNVDNIKLEGEGQGIASFELVPGYYDFGEINTGETSNPATFTLTNNGAAAGTVNSINIAGVNAANFSIVNMPVLPLTVNVNESINLNIVFSPDQAGEKIAQLNINTTNGNFMAAITGTGISQTAYSIPFIERWESGTFTHQDWTFDNPLSNWVFRGYEPETYYAAFMYQPRNYNYSSSLISPVINIEGVADLSLSLDFSLVGYMNSGTENFMIYVLENNDWIELDSYSNTEDIEWTTLTYDLSTLQSSYTQIRFEASGEDTEMINNWNIDNIVLDGTLLYAFAITPESADFGEIMTGTVSEPKTFTYTNTGALDLLINSSAIAGDQADAFILTDSQQYPFLLEVGQSRELTVQFAPQFEGTAHAELLISTEFQDFSSQLTGQGYDEFIATIPFMEDWSSGSFDTQQWVFDQEQTNWRIQANSGNPAPTARFNFSPIANDYSYSLISPRIQIPPNTQRLIVSYDLKLSDFQSEGTEWIKVHIWDGQDWQQINEVPNTGSTAWDTYQFDVSEYVAQETRLRFEATGSNSSMISNWEVDNISLQSIDWPKITVDPTEMIQDLLLGESITEQLTITNEGGSTLSFDATIAYDEPTGGGNWLQLSQQTGDIEAGFSLPIDVTFIAEGIQGMDNMFTAQILISSNDPDQPVVVVQATLSIIVSLNEIQVLHVKVYPNPVKETIYCTGIESIKKIQIFNNLGQSLYEYTTNGEHNHMIDVSAFQSGAYVIHMITESNDQINNTILINQ